MALSQKFRNVVPGAAVSMSFLYVDHRYPVVHADHAETKYGPTIRLALREQLTISLVLLPKRYSEVFTDEDVTVIKEQTIQYHLV
jgi:hypothetical protein